MKIKWIEEVRNKLTVWCDAKIVKHDKKTGKYFKDLYDRRAKELAEKKYRLEKGKAAYVRRPASYEIVDSAGNVVLGTPVDEETRILRAMNLETERTSAMNLILYGHTCTVNLLDDGHTPIDRDEYLVNGLGYLDLWTRALNEVARNVNRNRPYYERKVEPKVLDFNMLKLQYELDAAEDIWSIHAMRDVITDSMGHDRSVDPEKTARDEIWVFKNLSAAIEICRGQTGNIKDVLEKELLKNPTQHGYEEFELPELIENLIWFTEEYDIDDLYRRLTFVSNPEKLDYSELYRYHLRYESNENDLAARRISEEMKSRIIKMHSGDLSRCERSLL